MTSVQLKTLVEISRKYGSDASFVIAGGGNTSMKTEGRLFIKASGHSLASINPDGFVEMDRAQLDALLNHPLPVDVLEREKVFLAKAMAARIHPDRGQRPSVELLLHHLIPGRFVVHTHPTLVNMITCCKAGAALTREIFGDDVIWVPYVDPGFVLAKTLRQILAEHGREPLVIFMQNHGLLVSGDSAQQVDKRTKEILRRIQKKLDATPSNKIAARKIVEERQRDLVNTIAPALRGLLSDGDHLNFVTFDDSPAIRQLVGSRIGRAMAERGPLTPDQIVYCKSFPLLVDSISKDVVGTLRAKIESHRTKTGAFPKIVLVEGAGAFATGKTATEAAAALDVYRDAAAVMVGALRLGGVRPLAQKEYEFIERWEVESYRQKVSIGSGQTGRVSNKVILVTGAAQGIGREIAEKLADEGACVVLADRNLKGAQEAAAAIQSRRGQQQVIAAPIDVTDEQSVADCVHLAVRKYGGLDVLISNAGVLVAGAVASIPVDKFKFVTDVNYLGYFHCVRSVAPIMAMQRQAKPEYWSDIIQINSKSGLEGSNRNSAYAGSKFGGIGLTQSFALELIDSGIKVNAICPGNFFDGPLWSDSKNGLFAQYLHSGKVPGAKTIADVRKFYEAKVPMGRGCLANDLMKAIFYVIDQKYETGQAIPVTGGQVMLS